MKTLLVAFLVAATAAAGVYNFSDAVRDMAPEGRGADAFLELLNFVNTAKVEIDEPTRDFFDFLKKLVYKFEFNELLANPHMRPLPDDYKGVVFSGRTGLNKYLFNLTDASYDHTRVHNLGSLISEWGLKKTEPRDVKAQRSFEGRTRTKAGFRQFSQQTFLLAGHSLMKVLDPQNIQNMQALKPKKHRHITNESLQIIHEFYKAFPAFSEIFKKYIYIYHSLVTRQQYQGRQYTLCEQRAYIRVDKLVKDFPALVEYWENLRGFLKFSATMKNEAGLTLMDTRLDCENDFFYQKVLTYEGKLIPWDEKGNPVFEQAFNPVELADFPFSFELGMLFDVYGLKFNTQGIKVEARFENLEEKGNLSLRIVEMPRCVVSGKLGNVVPKWVLDLAIPRDIEAIVNDFSQVTENANNGRGTFANLAWDTASRNNVVFSMEGETEFLDNYYVGFGLSTLAYRLRTQGDTTREAKAFLAMTLPALISDLTQYSTAACAPQDRPD